MGKESLEIQQTVPKSSYMSSSFFFGAAFIAFIRCIAKDKLSQMSPVYFPVV